MRISGMRSGIRIRYFIRRSFCSTHRDAASIPASEASNASSSSSKSQLIDLFGRKHDYLRISLTEKCNLRCQYCMPEEGVQLTPQNKLLTSDEIVGLSSLFVNRLGVKKIRLTGGEPTVRKDFFELTSRIAQLKTNGLQTLAVTTNGISLSRRMAQLKEAGIDAVNISLDTLQPQKFEFISKRKGLHNVLMSIRSAIETGFPEGVKVNVVLMRGLNDDEIADFVQMAAVSPVDIRFIEYMPFTGNKWSNKKIVPFREMLTRIKNLYPSLEPDLSSVDNKKLLYNQTSKPYRVKGWAGRIGFITSMTENFCSSCNRIRVTADGNLKVCLFGEEEVSLRDMLRGGCSEDEIIDQMVEAVKRKKERHAGPGINSGVVALLSSQNRSAIHIQSRGFCTDEPVPENVTKELQSNSSFSHVDSEGRVRMVDVSSKMKTLRVAEAKAIVVLGSELIQRMKDLPKGDVLSASKIAGILAAKQTANLIPLCHQIPLSNVDITISLDEKSGEALIDCRVRTIHETGVEMEALTGAAVASLTMYDMCKSVNKGIVIRDVRLIHKSGGKSEYNVAD